jgi:hypothetical protein
LEGRSAAKCLGIFGAFHTITRITKAKTRSSGGQEVQVFAAFLNRIRIDEAIDGLHAGGQALVQSLSHFSQFSQ